MAKFYCSGGGVLHNKEDLDIRYLCCICKRRNSTLKRKYGINLFTYNQMHDDQNGKCAICGSHDIELGKRLVVDHDHDTGKVRGLLCAACNSGIGFFKDKTAILRKAIEYLIKDKEYIG